jgi:hypothetical protein
MATVLLTTKSCLIISTVMFLFQDQMTLMRRGFSERTSLFGAFRLRSARAAPSFLDGKKEVACRLAVARVFRLVAGHSKEEAATLVQSEEDRRVWGVKEHSGTQKMESQ